MHATCLSLVSPLGYRPEATAAALRAGISAYAGLPYVDAAGEPILGAVVEALPPEMRGRDRLGALAQMVFDTLAPEESMRLREAPQPLILCTRESARPGARLGSVVAALRWPDGQPIRFGRTGHVAAGPVGVLQALGLARALFNETAARTCLILALDSLIDARVLTWLDRHERLRTSVRTDGLIPGEAAGLLLATPGPLHGRGLAVRGVGVAKELATVMNDEPFRAEGLASALRAALSEAGVGYHDVAFRLSDVSGESYAFEELALAQSRVMRQVRLEQPLWHPAEGVGDCGAAAGLVQLAWAEQAFARGYAPGPLSALHASGAWGDRAAAIVADPSGGA